MDKDEMKNRISMALKDSILQHGFEIICKENAELKEKSKRQSNNYKHDVDMLIESVESNEQNLTKAREIIKDQKELLYRVMSSAETLSDFAQATLRKAEQFLNEDKAETSEEPYYVIMNMNCQYEICRKCPKSGLFKGTYEECENWIKEKLNEVEK